jgi:hypothetical protein
MKLHVGERLPGSGPPGQPGGYVVTAVVRESPWTHLYAARKILYNFDFSAQRCRESDETEWLDVLLRTYPNDHGDFAAAAHDEVRVVLANRASNLWPEPLDLLDGVDGEATPVLVLERPHGETLPAWLARSPAHSDRLALIAELLTFVEDAHREGLLLNGLGPEAFVIDGQGRIGYLATDCVVPRPARAWPQAALFPPERYVAGFAAPECLQPGGIPDERSDLFAWAAVAVFALTGEAVSTEPARLEAVLKPTPAAAVRAWAHSLGVDLERCLAAWPHNLVRVLERCVSPARDARPEKVAELRRWLAQPPPPAPAAALLVAVPDTPSLRVYYEMPAGAGPVEVIVRRETEIVAEGPAIGWLSIPAPAVEPTPHTVLFRAGGPGGVLSVPTPAPLVEPTPRALRQFVETVADQARPGDPEPPRVALLFRALQGIRVAEAMLASPLGSVRCWAVQRLTAMRQDSAAETLLWRALEDDHAAARGLAVAGLLTTRPGPEVVQRLFTAMARRPAEEGARALDALRRTGVDPALIVVAQATLASARPAACPECGVTLAPADAPAHLAQVHGYLEVGGAMLPRGAALSELWDRVFSQGDRDAHERLLQLLAAPTYLRTLEAETAQRADRLLAARAQEIPRLARGLRSSEAALPRVAQLLQADDPHVRQVGQEVLLLELVAQLLGGTVTAWKIRAQLNRLFAADRIDDKMQVCKLLPRAGIAAEPVAECLRQFEQERPVTCVLCGTAVPGVHLETHLRRSHRVFQFRGQIRSLEDTFTVLLDTVCGKRADAAAWTTLETIAREEHPADAEAYLAARLGQRLLQLPEPQRPRNAGAAAEAIVADPGATRLALALAAAPVAPWQPCAYQLALELAQRLPAPLPAEVLAAVQPRLADRHLPADTRLRAAAQLLRTTGPSGAAAIEVLRTLIGGSGKARAVDRLHQLEQLTGKVAAIDAVVTELEDQVRMSCPRCGVELRRVEMVGHLWDQHRLMLDGRRVREPWRVVEDWLEDYRVEGDPEVLQRCWGLARKIDPRQGSLRFQRLLLQHGIEDINARNYLLSQASQQRASLCPHCFALVPAVLEPLPSELHVERGLIEGDGYRVEMSRAGLSAWLELETPGGIVYEGGEPGRPITKLAALLYFALPLAVLTIMLPLLPIPLPVPGPLLALLTGGVLLVVLGVIFLAGNWHEGPLDPVLNMAWTELVPRLLEDRPAPADQAFIAGLALRSIGQGDLEVREEIVQEARQGFEDVNAAASYLGAMWRLTVEDADDWSATPWLADQAAQCFNGNKTLGLLTTLLAPFESEQWTDGRLRHLRVLMCARAFEAGLGPVELLGLAGANAALAEVLDPRQKDYVAHLHLVHGWHTTKPWRRLGFATTIFEMAENPKACARFLEELADVLLEVDLDPPLYFCVRGVSFVDTWFYEPPGPIDVVAMTLFEQGGYHLVIGPHRFWFEYDPAGLAVKLEQWFRYYFEGFCLQLATARAERSSAALRRVVARNGARCPECRRPVLPVVGEVGVAADMPRREEIPMVLPVAPA